MVDKGSFRPTYYKVLKTAHDESVNSLNNGFVGTKFSNPKPEKEKGGYLYC